MSLSYNKKLEKLNSIKHEIKKKRLFFDEDKDMFGFETMSQLIKVNNTSNIKGYPFVIYNKNDEKYGLKVVPLETKYDKAENPANLEHIILKFLTENVVNKNISPHFVHFLGHSKISNKSRAIKQLNLKKLEIENKIRRHSNVIISEYVNGRSIDNWVHEIYENDKSVSDLQWKIIVFQLIYTIYVMQVYFKLTHNDFHYGNIFIDDTIKPEGYYVYKIKDKTYYLKNTGIMPKIFDFEFAMAYGNKIEEAYPNKYIIGHCTFDKNTQKYTINDDSDLDDDDDNVPYNYNEFYDVHYFLTCMLDLYISEELFNWILSVYPSKVIPEDSTNSSDSSTDSSSDSSSGKSSDSSSNSSTDSSTDSSSDSSSNNSCDSSCDNSDLSSSYYSTTSDSSDSSYTTSHESESSESEKYVIEGRLVNGAEKLFTLPTPFELLSHEFFSEFLKKPDDFDEKTAVYFACN